ncbi:MAG: hypothetical protein A2W26_12055 [Acidobacteria bacterium RBG_16_64_8]|nr:MAG: hypothetical protein A2W26_12055 [Acidobacteria bacterium RBG_16_64_8]
MAQLGPIRVAHHTHAPGQVLWAAAHGIPSILLIRRPIDAVVSYILREPYLPPRQALSDWIGFYTTLKVEKKHLVLATFEEVTADFGQVVARLNAFYGVRFELPVVTEETTRHIFEQIEALHRLHRRSGVTDEMQVARPSPERGGPGSHLRALLMEAPSRPLLEEADRLYDSYLEDVSLSVPHLRRVPGRAGPGPAAAE